MGLESFIGLVAMLHQPFCRTKPILPPSPAKRSHQAISRSERMLKTKVKTSQGNSEHQRLMKQATV
jgi:hypothetical protein